MTANGDPLIAIAIGLAVGYAVASAIALRSLHRLGVATNPWQGLNRSELYQMVRAGLPVMANNLVALGAMFAVVGLAASAGTLDAAAYGVVFRVEQFGLIAINAVVLAMVPFAARAIGDTDPSRLRSTVKTALGVLLILGILIGICIIVGARIIVAPFALPPEGTALAVSWLKIAGAALAFQGVILLCTALLQIQHSWLALGITALRLYGLTLPAILLVGDYYDGLLYPTMSAVQILIGFVAIVFIWRWLTSWTLPPSAATSSIKE
jgi:Na+-driven multidrug efflux pump